MIKFTFPIDTGNHNVERKLWLRPRGPSTRMYFGRRTPMPVSFKDILEAFEFVSAGGMGEHQAFLCKQSAESIGIPNSPMNWANCRMISKTVRNTSRYLIRESSI